MATKMKHGETIELIPLQLVEFDHSWNSRTGEFRKDEEFQELIDSLRDNGQDIPILVRPHPDKTKAKSTPYSAVYGFRRGEALLAIARAQNESFKDKDARAIAKALGAQMVTVKATVKEMTEVQAREANIRENVIRKDLKAADCCFAVKNLSDLGRSTAEIKLSLGKAQTYVDKCKRVMGLPKDVLKDWRERALNPLSVDEMDQLSRLEGAEKQREAYDKLTSNKKPRSGKGKKSKVQALTRLAEQMATKLGSLARAELIEVDGDWDAIVDHLVSIPENFGPKETNAIAEAAEKAFELAKRPADEAKPGIPAPTASRKRGSNRAPEAQA